MVTRVLSIVLLLALTGCAMPSLRIFKAKVPEMQKPAQQEETERRAAAYIATVTSPPVPTNATAKIVADVHAVATGLSASLGAPKEPVTADDRDAIIAAQAKALGDAQRRLDAYRAFARKYAGQPIEGTGFNLLPFLGTGGLIAVIAFCVLCPVAPWIIGRLWMALRAVAKGIEQVAAKAPEHVAELKAELSRQMDRADKRAVKVAKLTISTPTA